MSVHPSIHTPLVQILIEIPGVVPNEPIRATSRISPPRRGLVETAASGAALSAFARSAALSALICASAAGFWPSFGRMSIARPRVSNGPSTYPSTQQDPHNCCREASWHLHPHPTQDRRSFRRSILLLLERIAGLHGQGHLRSKPHQGITVHFLRIVANKSHSLNFVKVPAGNQKRTLHERHLRTEKPGVDVTRLETIVPRVPRQGPIPGWTPIRAEGPAASSSASSANESHGNPKQLYPEFSGKARLKV